MIAAGRKEVVELFTVLLESTARLLRHHTARALDSTKFMFEGSKILVRAHFFGERERQRTEIKKSCAPGRNAADTFKCPAQKRQVVVHEEKKTEPLLKKNRACNRGDDGDYRLDRNATISKLISA